MNRLFSINQLEKMTGISEFFLRKHLDKLANPNEDNKVFLKKQFATSKLELATSLTELIFECKRLKTKIRKEAAILRWRKWRKEKKLELEK